MQEDIVKSRRDILNLIIVFINSCGIETQYEDENTMR